MKRSVNDMNGVSRPFGGFGHAGFSGGIGRPPFFGGGFFQDL
ncbi:hypothetical protein bpmyx0001_5410 [Bacillus pseudomycoides DSM 12442]|nr:hypothetical protein bpmyx0001_5410 [Bacillus pseudomycoides DSM 12442]